MAQVRCEACDGTGVIVSVEPAPIKGSKLRSSVHTCEMRRFCGACRGTGKVAPPPSPAPVTAGGQVVDAPGFTQADFDAALRRAYAEGLSVVATGHPGVTRVENPASGHRYVTTRARCSCPAGARRGTCKHRALVVHLDAIAQAGPVARHQWAQARKAVAA